jgi:hypothetical protein
MAPTNRTGPRPGMINNAELASSPMVAPVAAPMAADFSI